MFGFTNLFIIDSDIFFISITLGENVILPFEIESSSLMNLDKETK